MAKTPRTPKASSRKRARVDLSEEQLDATEKSAGGGDGGGDAPAKRDPHVVQALEYIEGVLSGAIPACKYVRQACQRQRDDLERFKDHEVYYFDEGLAGRVCRFLELLPHIQGPEAFQRPDGTWNTVVLQPWQSFIVTTVFGWRRKDTGGRRYRKAYVEVPRGNGKALSTETPIPTLTGWSRMGDLRVGDVVFDEMGKPCNVVAATEVMGNRPCYAVEFSTGETIVADAEHQWMTDSRRDRDRMKGRSGKHAGPKPSVKTTEEIAASVMCRKERNHRIRVCGAVELPEVSLPVPPYTLGAWLGDGHTDQARITVHYSDLQILREIEKEGISTAERKSTNLNSGSFILGSYGRRESKKSLQATLRRIGVLGNKHIPSAYLRASRQQRMALLQGLMDTDGFISKGQGQCEFTSTLEVLARGAVELAASLGFRPTIGESRATLYGRDCGPKWRVMFHAYSDVPVFRLDRKVARLKHRSAKGGQQDHRRIVSAAMVDSVPVRCIEVDSPSRLFLAGRGFIPTHNSFLLSGLAIYGLTSDSEEGPENYSAAVTKEQASKVFDIAKSMLRKKPEFAAKIGAVVLEHKILCPKNNGEFFALSRETSRTGDGKNPHIAVVDELHAHKTRAIYDVLKSAMKKRVASLLFVITTAGFDTSGICYEVRGFCVKMLAGEATDDSQFGIIYTIDEGDDWLDEVSWRKANPNWGISVQPDSFASDAAQAAQIVSEQNNFKTKNLDVWCNADRPWMDMAAWDRCGDRTLDRSQFSNKICTIGLDLATKVDIAAKATLFWREIEEQVCVACGYTQERHPVPIPETPQGPAHICEQAAETKTESRRHYYLFMEFYLPAQRVIDSKNSQYKGWVGEGYIKTTPGDVTDFTVIQQDVVLDRERFVVHEVGYDEWQAQSMANTLAESGLTMVKIAQKTRDMSAPMKEVEALVIDGRFHHDANPAMRWMVSNVVAQEDAHRNVLPTKTAPENKIDGPVALFSATNRGMVAPSQASTGSYLADEPLISF